ncbi:MAG TPA: hypothetical protein VHD87_15265 [Acidimicrobiales bacterium]|nr:hypothetical protein [Acidimicrobiales bacterium]
MTRRYAMRRLAAGDYLWPSDDLTTLWRFHQHRDGTAHGLVDVSFRDRMFWRAVSMPWNPHVWNARAEDIPDAWSAAWVEADWYLPTRAACVALALRRG